MLTLLITLAFAAPDAGAVPSAPLLASLERTACYGVCPVYLVKVFTDGRVEWEGRKHVKVKGQQIAQLNSQGLAALKQAFADAGFLKLSGNFACLEATDHASAKVTFVDGENTVLIDHYDGCRSTPGVEVLTKLEQQFDVIVNTARWTGPPSGY